MDVSLKLVIPLDGDIRGDDYIRGRFKESMFSGTKADFVLRAKSDKVGRLRKQSSYKFDQFYKPGVYQFSTSLRITKLGESDTR